MNAFYSMLNFDTKFNSEKNKQLCKAMKVQSKEQAEKSMIEILKSITIVCLKPLCRVLGYRSFIICILKWIGSSQTGRLRMNGTRCLASGFTVMRNGARRDEYVYNVPFLFFPGVQLSKIVVGYLDQQHQLYCKAKGYISRTNREFIRFFDPAEEVITFSKSLRYNVRKALRVNPVFVEETSERILQKLHELLQATHACRNDKHKGHYRMYPYIGMTKEGVDSFFIVDILNYSMLKLMGDSACVLQLKDKRMFG